MDDTDTKELAEKMKALATVILNADYPGVRLQREVAILVTQDANVLSKDILVFLHGLGY